MTKEVKKIGVVSVDSGQIMICDPCYISDEYEDFMEDEKYSGHKIYFHRETGKLWQFCYNGEYRPYHENVTPFPGTYSDIIPEYGKTPNHLKDLGEFIESDIDPRPYIKDGEFSYRGMSKMTTNNLFGQFNFKNGYEAGVVSNTGYGDGVYDVYAEILNGCQISKIWIDFIIEEE